MRRCHVFLFLFVSLTVIPFSVRAETTPDTPIVDPYRHRGSSHIENHAGFHIAIPSVDQKMLVGQIKILQSSLKKRHRAIAEYLTRNRLDAKDALITVIMPGGLLYAAYRKGSLEQAESELAGITEDMDELARDLLAMQLQAGDLTIARLQ